jgi:hypothetical protein
MDSPSAMPAIDSVGERPSEQFLPGRKASESAIALPLLSVAGSGDAERGEAYAGGTAALASAKVSSSLPQPRRAPR